MDDSADWLRSRPARVLLAAALALSLILGAAFVVLGDQPAEAPVVQGEALTDEQAADQVVDAARVVVAAAGLKDAAGGYSFLSCSTGDGPPYQAVLHLTFALPQQGSARYLDGVAAAMTARGWRESPAAAEHFGHKLTAGGLMAELSRNTENRAVATLRMYGECRNTSDHRDDPAWTEVSL